MMPAVPVTDIPEPGAAAEREVARTSLLSAPASLLFRTPSKTRLFINLEDNEFSLDRSDRHGGRRWHHQRGRQEAAQEVD
jgi:hypothetical protein